MTAPVDLRRLAERESEQVEWKATVADVNDVVKTLSAFANDLPNLGGGYVVCGASEEKDEHGFQRLVRFGLAANRFKEVEGEVMTRFDRDVVLAALRAAGTRGLRRIDIASLIPGVTMNRLRGLLRNLQKASEIHPRGSRASARWYIGPGRETP